MLEYETSEPIAPFTLLQNAGVTISAPEQLDDTALSGKLNELFTNLLPLAFTFNAQTILVIENSMSFFTMMNCAMRHAFFLRIPLYATSLILPVSI